MSKQFPVNEFEDSPQANEARKILGEDPPSAPVEPPQAPATPVPALDDIYRMAAEYSQIKPQVDALYAKADELRQRVQDGLEGLGIAKISLPSGETVEVVDNFANTNVVFRPAAVRRFELVIKPPAKPKKGK